MQMPDTVSAILYIFFVQKIFETFCGYFLAKYFSVAGVSPFIFSGIHHLVCVFSCGKVFPF